MAKSEAHSRAKSGMGGHKSSSKSGKKPHSIHVRRGKSGGFIAEHHHSPDEDGVSAPSEEHVLPDMQALQAHLQQNLGDQSAAPAAPPPDPGATGPAGPVASPAGM